MFHGQWAIYNLFMKASDEHFSNDSILFMVDNGRAFVKTAPILQVYTQPSLLKLNRHNNFLFTKMCLKEMHYAMSLIVCMGNVLGEL